MKMVRKELLAQARAVTQSRSRYKIRTRRRGRSPWSRCVSQTMGNLFGVKARGQENEYA